MHSATLLRRTIPLRFLQRALRHAPPTRRCMLHTAAVASQQQQQPQPEPSAFQYEYKFAHHSSNSAGDIGEEFNGFYPKHIHIPSRAHPQPDAHTTVEDHPKPPMMDTLVLQQPDKRVRFAMTTVRQPIPHCRSHQLLVRVLAVGINPLDSMMAEGYNHRITQTVHPNNHGIQLGREGVGMVEQAGQDQLNYTMGDIVWFSVDPLHSGCFAEYVVLGSNEVSRAPKTMDLLSLASTPFAVTTAWTALITIGGLGPVSKATASDVPPLLVQGGPNPLSKLEQTFTSFVNVMTRNTSSAFDTPTPFSEMFAPYHTSPRPMTVFIHGGSGSIGTFAVQLLKAWGHRVIVTAHPSHHQRMVDLGCEHVIDYTSEHFVRALDDYVGVGGIDIFLDGVGGNEVESQAEALKVRHFITLRSDLVTMMDYQGLSRGLASAAYDLERKKLRWMTTYGARYDWAVNRPSGAALQYVTKFVDRHLAQHPAIDKADLSALHRHAGLESFVDRDSSFRGLNEVISAVEQMQDGKATNGKLVVEFPLQ